MFFWVSEFVVAVGEFVGAEVELEAFGHGISAAIIPESCQRALRRRPVDDRQQFVVGELRLQSVRHQQVQPVVSGQSFEIDENVAERVAQFVIAHDERIDAKRIAVQVAVAHHAQHRRTPDQHQRGVDQFRGFFGEPQVIPTDAIPLEHGEFWVVATPGFAVAKHAPEFVAIAEPCREQALERVFRRSAQPARARRAVGTTGEFERKRSDIRLAVAAARQHRRFDFEHTTFGEKIADERIQSCAQTQCVERSGWSPVRILPLPRLRGRGVG